MSGDIPPTGTIVPERGRQGKLAHALSYAARGWHVLPLNFVQDGQCSCPQGADADHKRAGKHPLGLLVAHGEKDASTDSAVIEGWWSLFPQANVGVATGVRSGIDVLDIDGEVGKGTLDALIQKHGPLPRTVIARSGSGGTHYYFRHNPATRTKKNLAPGIDVRADGGLIVAPPSTNLVGRYEWIVPPDTVEIAAWPDWLLGVLFPPTPDPAPEPTKPDRKLREVHDDEAPASRPPFAGDRSALDRVCVGCPLLKEWFDQQEAGTKLDHEFWIAGLGVVRHLPGGVEEAERLDRKVMAGKFSLTEFNAQVQSLTRNPTTCAKLAAKAGRADLGCGTLKNPCSFPKKASPFLHTTLTAVPAPEKARPKKVVQHEIKEAVRKFFTPEGPDTMLIAGESGIGKTTTTEDVIAETKARVAWVAPTHDLLDQIVTDLRSRGADAAKRPELKATCDDENRRPRVVALQNRGEDYESLVCRGCPKKKAKTCPYWSQVNNLKEHQVSVYPNVMAKLGPKFWKDVEGKYLVIDEDPTQALMPLLVKTKAGLRKIRAVHKRAARATRGLAGKLLDERVALIDKFVAIFEGSTNDVTTMTSFDLPIPTTALVEKTDRRAFAKALARARRAMPRAEKYRKLKLETAFFKEFERFARRVRRIVGLIDRTHPDAKKHVLVLHHRVFVPPTVKILVLDATGDSFHLAKLLGRPEIGVVGGPVEHGSNLVQHMDQSFGIDALKGAGVREAAVAAVRRLLAGRDPAEVAIITHKKFELEVKAAFPAVRTAHFGEVRGMNNLAKVRKLIVLGSPRKPFYVVRATALFLYGIDTQALAERPKRLHRLYRGRLVETYGFDHPLLERAWRYHVGAEVLQAAGRGRYVWEPEDGSAKEVAILSNEILPLPGIKSNYLFDGDGDGLRSDGVRTRGRLLETTRALLREGRPINRKIAAGEAGMSPHTAREHWPSVVIALGLVQRGRFYISQSGELRPSG